MATISPHLPATQIQAEDYTGFCMALGYIGQNWALVEQNFDMWIAMIYHGLDGRTKINKALPIGFKRKIRFLREAFNQLPTLKPFSIEATKLFDKAMAICDDRNDLTHGVLKEMEPINGKWQMLVFDTESPRDEIHWHAVREFTFSPDDFRELEGKLVPLAGEVALLGLKLHKSIP